MNIGELVIKQARRIKYLENNLTKLNYCHNCFKYLRWESKGKLERYVKAEVCNCNGMHKIIDKMKIIYWIANAQSSN